MKQVKGLFKKIKKKEIEIKGCIKFTLLLQVHKNFIKNKT